LRINALAWGVLLAFGCIVLGALLQTPNEKTPLDQLLADPLSIALMGIFAIALAPVFEELLFRGFLFPLLARSLGPVAAAALAALPFALLHGPEYAWSWQRISIIFLAGFAFGWMRHRSGSTAAAAVMHAGYNGTFVLVLVLSRYGGWTA
jgi:membrane protease YdiL (CAAX protease family)